MKAAASAPFSVIFAAGPMSLESSASFLIFLSSSSRAEAACFTLPSSSLSSAAAEAALSAARHPFRKSRQSDSASSGDAPFSKSSQSASARRSVSQASSGSALSHASMPSGIEPSSYRGSSPPHPKSSGFETSRAVSRLFQPERRARHIADGRPPSRVSPAVPPSWTL